MPEKNIILPPMPSEYSDEALLRELEPTATKLLHRHIASSDAKAWYPHELTPWSRGQDFAPGYKWTKDELALPEGARPALNVNLLTEDNLPFYYATISLFSDGPKVYQEWARRWTAEEGRHAIVIRDYLMIMRALDPVKLEKDRMTQVSNGIVPNPPNTLQGFVYVAMQEPATKISHRNTGRLLTDPVGKKIMATVAGDEALHENFYGDLTVAALKQFPSASVIAMAHEIINFAMPGTGIPEFDKQSKAIRKAGIFSIEIYKEQVVDTLLDERWKIKNLGGLTPDAEQAREKLFKHLDRLQKTIDWTREKRAAERN